MRSKLITITQILLYITLVHDLFVSRVIPSVLDPRKCEYLKDYSLDFEHAYTG
jgi:hypothetical protein